MVGACPVAVGDETVEDEIVVVSTTGCVTVAAPVTGARLANSTPSAFLALEELTNTITHTPGLGIVALKWYEVVIS